MVQEPQGVLLSGTLTGKLYPLEVSGIGKGHRRIYNPPKSRKNQGDDTYKSDIGQIANGLAEVAFSASKFKHTPIPDSSGKTPIYFVVEDITSRTKYVVLGCVVYEESKRHLAIGIVQDDTCDYDPALLEEFFNSLRK